MDYRYYIKKWKYYRDWYESMTAAERDTEIGRWVFDNCSIYHDLLKELKSSPERVSKDMTNGGDQ